MGEYGTLIDTTTGERIGPQVEAPWSQGVEMVCTKAIQQANRESAADTARAVLAALAERGWLAT